MSIVGARAEEELAGGSVTDPAVRSLTIRSRVFPFAMATPGTVTNPHQSATTCPDCPPPGRPCEAVARLHLELLAAPGRDVHRAPCRRGRFRQLQRHLPAIRLIGDMVGRP